MRLIILGAGGFGHTIKDVAEQSGIYSGVFFLDDAGTGADIIGKWADFASFIDGETVFFPAIGDNVLRCEYLGRLEDAGAKVATIVHSSAYVSPTAVIGVGSTVLPGAIVNTDVSVGKGCIVNIGAIVDHGCVLEDGVHVAPGAIVKGENRITAFSKVESGVVIKTGHFPVGR